jgi:signal transduction histidine kinase
LATKLNLEDAKEVLKSNLQEVETMTSMISRLLELSKIREGESITKEVDVAIEKVISTAIKTVNNSAKSKNITIVKKDVSKSLLTINSGVIQQVLTIILDNAIKYSPTNSSIIIVGKKSIINSCYQIMVSDHGPGVPKNQKTQIFQRFHQVDSSRSKKNNSGQGLGLAISKELLLKHGGSVELTKSSSKGSTFTIELPF